MWVLQYPGATVSVQFANQFQGGPETFVADVNFNLFKIWQVGQTPRILLSSHNSSTITSRREGRARWCKHSRNELTLMNIRNHFRQNNRVTKIMFRALQNLPLSSIETYLSHCPCNTSMASKEVPNIAALEMSVQGRGMSGYP